MTFNSAEHRQRIKEQSKAVADYMDAKLSFATQEVLDAFRLSHTGPGCLAAALRAAALYCKRDTLILLSIADELEGF